MEERGAEEKGGSGKGACCGGSGWKVGRLVVVKVSVVVVTTDVVANVKVEMVEANALMKG